MPRVKRGTQHNKKRGNLLKRVKGFQAGRKNLIKLAKTADTKSSAQAYIGRKTKKRNARRLWQVKINAAVRTLGTTYSKFIGNLKKNNIEIDRKVLSQVAENYPKVFEKIVKAVE